MECSSMAVATCFRLLATILLLLLAMGGRCYSQQMDHIQLVKIAESINNLTHVVQEQAVASRNFASGLMRMFTYLATDNFVCEKGWLKLRASCYFISEDTSNWEESRQKCLALNSDLVKITRHDEYHFLRDLVKGQDTYIGLSDLQEEGTYRWVVDGTIHQIVKSWWGKDEPSSSRERCIHYYNAKNNRLNDVNCANAYRYICEKPAKLGWNFASVAGEEDLTDE